MNQNQINQFFIVIGCYNIQMKQQSVSNYKLILAKHQNFLKKFNTFPDKTRKGIYIELLQIPLNHNHFIELTKPYPLLPEHSVDKQVSFIVSAFTKLYPDLGNQWLPGLIYPFVKLFKEDSIAAFQISLTFLLNWFRPIFENYPNPSKSIMNFFSKHLKALQKRVNSFDYPLSAIIQPMLLVSLTDILNKKDTLQILDFLVSNPFKPELFLCVAVKIISMVQDILCGLNSIESISLGLRKQKNLTVRQIIEGALQISATDQEDLSLIYNDYAFPICKGRYPVCQFVKKTQFKENKAFQKMQEDELNRVTHKFNKLNQLVSTKLQSGLVSDSNDINDRYRQVDGQMKQYLNQIKLQHKNKLQALRQLEQDFKFKINNQGNEKMDQYQKNIDAIERRGRLEKQILMMENEANSIRKIEEEFMRRMEEVSRLKKSQLMHENLKLRQEQRNQRLFS